MKEIRVFAYAIGGYYAIMGLLSTFMVSQLSSIKEFYEVWGIPTFMFDKVEYIQNGYATVSPWLIPIGIGFLAFGWYMPKIKEKILYLSILSVLLLGWALYACIYIGPLMGHMYDDFPLQNDMVKGMGVFIQVIFVGTTLLQFTLPQFFMGREILKFERKEKDGVV